MSRRDNNDGHPDVDLLFDEEEEEEMIEREEHEEGPYGGAFSSWDEFYRWKEGPGFFN